MARRTWQAEVLWENVDPHLNLSLHFRRRAMILQKKSHTDCSTQHPLCCWYTLSIANEYTVNAVLTWDRLGWWELRRVLVSTCSGARPWFLRTCRASLSLAGPMCWWITVFVSARTTEHNKIQSPLHTRHVYDKVSWNLAVPKSWRLYCLPEKVSELPSPSMRGGGIPRTLATRWRIWVGFSWSLHWLIPELQDNSGFVSLFEKWERLKHKIGTICDSRGTIS